MLSLGTTCYQNFFVHNPTTIPRKRTAQDKEFYSLFINFLENHLQSYKKPAFLLPVTIKIVNFDTVL